MNVRRALHLPAALPREVAFGALLSLYACFVFMTGCDQRSGVRSTSPADGEVVDAETTKSIQVTYSSTFNNNSDANEDLTNPENFTVLGEGDRQMSAGTPGARERPDDRLARPVHSIYTDERRALQWPAGLPRW